MTISLKCQHCKQSFETYPHRANIAKYCSFKCYWNSMRGKKKPKVRITLKCAACGKKFKVKPSREKTRKHCSKKCYAKTQKKMSFSEEAKRKMSQNSSRYWLGKHRSEKTREKLRCARLKQVFPLKDTSIEVAMQKALRNRKIPFKKHVPLIGKYQVDLLIENSLVVECYGDYWHNLPNYKQRDKKREREIKQHGFDFLVFWEHEIKENTNGCVEKIMDVLNN